eukprot:4755840-Alexandrium_andersonii.AAC.1
MAATVASKSVADAMSWARSGWDRALADPESGAALASHLRQNLAGRALRVSSALSLIHISEPTRLALI